MAAAGILGPARHAAAAEEDGTPAAVTADRSPHGVPLEGRIPLFYEANRGQAPARWDFLVRCKGYHAYVRSGEVVFDLGGAPLAVALDGARDVEPDVRGFEMTGRANYLIGNDETKWITDVPLSRGAAYRGVAPETTWRFGAKERCLDFTLTVPGTAEPAFRFSGARAVSLAADGALLARMPAGEAAFTAPVAWQIEATGARRAVAARFDVGEPSADGSTPVRIALGPRNPGLRTFIDPTVSWVTYLGAASYDAPAGVRLDASGGVFLAGSTTSASFPATSGAYDTSHASMEDAFVAKLASDGATLSWATFVGTSAVDFSEYLELDSSGRPVVAGATFSSSFPTTNGAAHTTDPVGAGQSSILFKLNATGSALEWSTYLPITVLRGMSITSSADVILAETTGVRSFASNGSASNWFTRITPTTTQFSSTLRTVYVDGSDDIWIGAESGTPKVATTTGAYLTSAPGGYDASLTKMSSSGAVIWSTLFGGSADDDAKFIGVDQLGRPTLVGWTRSSGIASVSGSLSGSDDAFIARFSADGSTLRYASYFGGSGGENAEFVSDAAVHPTGTLVLVGSVTSAGIPISNAFQSSHAGGYDAFVVKMSPTNEIVWSSYFGGTGDESLSSIAMAPNGSVVLAGRSLSSGLATSGAYQTTQAGFEDAILLKIPDSLPTTITFPEIGSGPPPTTVGVAQTYAIGATGGVPPYAFHVAAPPLPSGFTVAADGTFSGTAAAVGSVTFTLGVTDAYDFSATRQLTHVVNPSPSITTATLTDWTSESPMSQTLASAGGTGAHTWSVASGDLPEGVTLAPDGRLVGTPATAGTFTFAARATDSVGASATRDLTLEVNPRPAIDAQTLPDWTSGRPQTLSFSSSGGTPPIVWSVAAGAAPLGTLEPEAGRLTGNTYPPGEYAFTLRATDARGSVAEREFQQVVNAFPSILTTSLPVAAAGRRYATRIDAAGGTPPAGFSIVSGRFGTGLSFGADGAVTGTPAGELVNDVTVEYGDVAGAKVQRTISFECAGAVDLAKKKAKDSFPLVVGQPFRALRYLELTRGSALSVTVSGGGSKAAGPSITLRRSDGSDVDLGSAIRRAPKGATLKKLAVPATDRYFLEVSADSAARGTVKFTMTIVAPAKFAATVPADGASAPAEIPFSAPPGAKLTIAAKPAKKSAARPLIVAITGPGDADVLAAGIVKSRGTTVSFTSAAALTGGDYVLRLGATPGTAGLLTHTVTLRLPRTYDFEMLDVSAGEGQ